MIVVDTNVLSEVMRPIPSDQVVRWMAARSASSLFTTTITLVEEEFTGRILTFDRDAARAFADISARCRRLGRPIGEMDAQIAGIARSRGAAIATRNVLDFQDCGVQLIDPWS